MSNKEFGTQVASSMAHLKSFAYHFTRNLEDTEDLIQDTVLKALRYKDHFEPGTNLRGWLFTIMRSIFINGYKRNQLLRRVDPKDNNEFNFLRVSGVDTISSELGEKEIRRAMAGLSYELQTPFVMYVDGFQYDEIAAAMTIPMGTVKSRIHHARKKLMAVLSDFR